MKSLLEPAEEDSVPSGTKVNGVPEKASPTPGVDVDVLPQSEMPTEIPASSPVLTQETQSVPQENPAMAEQNPFLSEPTPTQEVQDAPAPNDEFPFG